MILDWPVLVIFLTLTACFPLISNPLRLGVTLLFCCILIVWGLAIIRSTFWVSYTLILVLVGGLIVVFIYVSLLASNELFVRTSSVWATAGCVAVVFSSFVGVAFGFKGENLTEELNSTQLSNFFESPLLWVSKFYSYDLGNLTLFLVFYLLFTLIIVVSICKNSSLALRSQIS